MGVYRQRQAMRTGLIAVAVPVTVYLAWLAGGWAWAIYTGVVLGIAVWLWQYPREDAGAALSRWFLSPALAVLVISCFLPLGYIFYLSVHKVDIISFGGEWPWAGLSNYVSLLTDPEVWRITLRTLEFVVLAVGLEMVLGFAIAALFNREFRSKGLVVSLMLLPFMVSPIVAGLLWKSMLGLDNGLINQLLALVGLPGQPWLTDIGLPGISSIPFGIGPWLVEHLNARFSFLSILITEVWGATPFVFLVLLAGLHGLPQEPLEAARVDGATKWQTLRFVTLPLLRPLIVVLALLRAMDAMKVYASIWALFGNSVLTSTLNIHLGTLTTVRYEYGRAGALSALVLALVTVLVMGFVRQQKGDHAA